MFVFPNILVKVASEIKYFFDIFQEMLVINYNYSYLDYIVTHCLKYKQLLLLSISMRYKMQHFAT